METSRTLAALAAAAVLLTALPVQASAAGTSPAAALMLSAQSTSDIPQYTNSAGVVKECYHLEGKPTDEWYKPAAEAGKHLRCGAGLDGVWIGVAGAAAIAGIIVAVTHNGKPKSP